MDIENLTDGVEGDKSFHSFVIKDVNPLGGTSKKRLIFAPSEPMKIVHARLIKAVRDTKFHSPFATGAGEGDSPVKNVLKHRNNRFFYILDIKSAYQNVNGERLAGVISEILSWNLQQTISFLERYCLTANKGLITGAPASPDLFNLYCGKLIDPELGKLCAERGIAYTRYLDDLTFSSEKPVFTNEIRKKIRHILKEANFSVNDWKAKLIDLRKGAVAINGIGLELGGRLFLPRSYTRKLRGMIVKAMTTFDVSPAVIHGSMGVFLSLSKGRRMNRTESGLADLYQQYRDYVKKLEKF